MRFTDNTDKSTKYFHQKEYNNRNRYKQKYLNKR